MDDTQHLRVAFFIIEQYGEVILVERGFYLGFPGDCIREGEDLSLCARRVASAFGRSIDESDLFQVMGSTHDWNGHPAMFDIYTMRDTDTRKVVRRLARPYLGKRRPFDRFVDIFMKAPHRVVHPRRRSQKILSAV